jgi:hypothetical protein
VGDPGVVGRSDEQVIFHYPTLLQEETCMEHLDPTDVRDKGSDSSEIRSISVPSERTM